MECPSCSGVNPDGQLTVMFCDLETPNLAARLQSQAGPNEVVIGPGNHPKALLDGLD